MKCYGTDHIKAFQSEDPTVSNPELGKVSQTPTHRSRLANLAIHRRLEIQVLTGTGLSG